MSKKRPVGICHLCGKLEQLSFEHVPPRSAFNNLPVVEASFFKAVEVELGKPPQGRINQRGAGAYTLCEQCNNHTGHWYANEFAMWSYQGMKVLSLSQFKPKLIYLHYIHPLRVLKQILTMCFSVNPPQWRKRYPELEAFVLDRDRQWLNPQHRTFAYFNIEGQFRRVGKEMAHVNLNKGSGVISVTEIAHPPFGYVLTNDGTCPDERLCEITHFRRYSYDEFEVTPLNLPLLPTHLPLPLDYRSLSEIEEQSINSDTGD